MKNVHVLALTILVLSLLLGGSVEARAAGCDPIGNVRFICHQVGPEDLAAVPGSDWVLASGMTMNGAIRLINLRDNTTTVLFPTATPRERMDKKTYGSCPGPIGSEGDNFRAHGLYLRSASNAVHTLYVVHHGDRESIEVFEFDARPKLPVLTWIGCAVAPDPIGLNSVVGLADGGFITTNFSPRGSDAAARTRMMAGENNGQVWEWHPATGWKIVPGSEAAGPNGLEISKDGKWLYVGGWGSQSVIRLSRGQSPPKKDTVAVGFRVDNLRWAPDGTLLAAGQGGTAPSQTSNVVRVDPATLKFKELVRYPDIEGFGVTTVAIQVGKDLWLGSVRGDRIAIFPLVQSSSGTVGADQPSQAAVGARLMRGAVDLHYHVDPGYGTYENLAQAKAAGVRALLLKNHFEPTGAIVMLLRPQFPGLELYSGFVFNRSNGGVNVAGIEYMASISGEPKPPDRYR